MTESALECEADQRQAEIIVTELGLKEESKGVATPGVSESEGASSAPGDDGEFEERAHRTIAARAKYLAQDKSDI